MCIRPLLKQFLPSLFPSTHAPETREKSITNPNWEQNVEMAALKLSSNIKGSRGRSIILDDERGWMELEERQKGKMPTGRGADHEWE
jgi:hypothetical protein